MLKPVLPALLLSATTLLWLPTTHADGPPGRKPDYVKCDPQRPELPCTPDSPPPEELKRDRDDGPPGRKPHYVKCDPDRPELPCTPDSPPPEDLKRDRNDDPPGRKPDYVKCDPARPELPCTPDQPAPRPEKLKPKAPRRNTKG
jgi:hypothetical protein